MSTVVEGKEFKYDNLLMQAETYSFNGTPLNTSIHRIDDLMIDAYHIYHKIKITEERVNEFLDQLSYNQIKLPFNKDELNREKQNFENIIENILENCKFDDPEIVGIQRGYLSVRMEECVRNEEYELAAKYRDIIKVS